VDFGGAIFLHLFFFSCKNQLTDLVFTDKNNVHKPNNKTFRMDMQQNCALQKKEKVNNPTTTRESIRKIWPRYARVFWV